MRISDAALASVLILSGCNRPVDQAAAGTTVQADAGRTSCAHGPGPLRPVCTIERTGAALTIRHPNGGFRRLSVIRDGRGVLAADGAEAARVEIVGPGDIEVTLGNDRYRLPATIKAAGTTP